MPRFDPTGEVATNYDRNPGRWLVKIPRVAQIGKDKPPRPGIETLDQNGQDRRSKSGNLMWSAAAEVIDDHPDAPRGAMVLGINLLWEGKGRDATYGLLARMGHPVDAWKRETDPAKQPDIGPDYFYDRPFVLDCVLNDKGYLAPKDEFCPYYPKTARRGPAPSGGSGANGGGGGSKGGKPGPANPALAAGGGHAAAPATGDDSLPF
jgi:hypothetical protein